VNGKKQTIVMSENTKVT